MICLNISSLKKMRMNPQPLSISRLETLTPLGMSLLTLSLAKLISECPLPPVTPAPRAVVIVHFTTTHQTTSRTEPVGATQLLPSTWKQGPVCSHWTDPYLSPTKLLPAQNPNSWSKSLAAHLHHYGKLRGIRRLPRTRRRRVPPHCLQRPVQA